jgi:hypothetical protein
LPTKNGEGFYVFSVQTSESLFLFLLVVPNGPHPRRSQLLLAMGVDAVLNKAPIVAALPCAEQVQRLLTISNL